MSRSEVRVRCQGQMSGLDVKVRFQRSDVRGRFKGQMLGSDFRVKYRGDVNVRCQSEM